MLGERVTIPSETQLEIFMSFHGPQTLKDKLPVSSLTRPDLLFHHCVTRQSVHLSARNASIPSLAMSGTITSAPAGSAHIPRDGEIFQVSPAS
jgi:hypothetical protein